MAKDKGGDRVELYTPDPAWRERLQAPPGWAERLARALAQDRLVAYVQPILDLPADRLVKPFHGQGGRGRQNQRRYAVASYRATGNGPAGRPPAKAVLATQRRGTADR